MVGVLTAVVRICHLDVPVATSGLSTAAALLDFVTEHISLAVLEVHIGLLVHIDDGEHLVGDESVSTLHVGSGDVRQRTVNVTQISHLRHFVSLLPTYYVPEPGMGASTIAMDTSSPAAAAFRATPYTASADVAVFI